jgi:hypothetical protein
MSNQKTRYAIEHEDRLTKDEYYGPVWAITTSDGPGRAGSVILVPDPGDGSALPLARLVVELLNGLDGIPVTLPKW